jgi:peroxiredoxin
MKIGTSVTDVRISRRIGYWNGAGLVDFVSSKETNAPAAPDRSALLAAMENDPHSAEALAAATWFLLNSPDSSDVEKAAEVILDHHLTSPDLGTLAQDLERMRHRSSRKLLEAIVEQNPDSEIRATACFTLAILLRDEAQFGKDKAALRDAERYFERVMEFAGSKPKGADFARRARPELFELRNLTIGHPVPELAGADFDGQRVKLSDYRGKTVVLFFWTVSTARDAAEETQLLEQLPDHSFAVIGVNCDENRDKAKAAAEARKLNWPTIFDGRYGPIATAWNTRSWLSCYVIDARGVIRYRNERGRDLTNAVATLLRH